MSCVSLPEENMDAINVSTEESDWVCSLSGYVLETEKVIWHLRRPSHLTGPGLVDLKALVVVGRPSDLDKMLT